jgi:hypothetical protein
MPEIIICPRCARGLTWADTPDCAACVEERRGFWRAAVARMRRASVAAFGPLFAGVRAP